MTVANLQVKNISAVLYERLRRYARVHNCTISATILTALERELANWEWRERLARRPKTHLGMDAAELLREERTLRDRETG